MKSLISLLALCIGLSLSAQIPNGSVAPDFTLTDYYGTSHNLYSYLNSGKTVFLEVFAAHCGSCWGYHQTNRLKNMYTMYGPNVSDEVMVLALEHDQWNDTNAFIGNGPPWVTQGNWLTGTPYPIFDVEDPDRGVFADYNVNFYPVIFKICPDGIVERVFTNQTEAQLYQKVQDCQVSASINEVEDLGKVYVDPLTRELVIERYESVNGIEVCNTQGQLISAFSGPISARIGLPESAAGMLLVRFNTMNGVEVRTFLLD